MFWKFRLIFSQPVVPSAPAESPEPSTQNHRGILRRPRSFSPIQQFARRELRRHERATAEEIAVLQEQASREHCSVVARLAELLMAIGWTGVEEIPGAVDLWANSPDGSGRVIFEVKTQSGSNEIHQCRAALSQLLEYRFFYGADADRHCLVLNRPIADRRRAFIENLQVAVLLIDADGAPSVVGRLAQNWFGDRILLTRT
jgi:hypothetical protein